MKFIVWKCNELGWLFPMASRVKKHLDSLKILRKAKPKFRKNFLLGADNDLIKCLCECSLNVLNGNIKLSKNQKKSLRKHRKNIRTLAAKKVGLKRKRKILIQKGGFLPALLAPVLGIAGSLIGDLLRR